MSLYIAKQSKNKMRSALNAQLLRADSLEKTLMLGGIGGRRRKTTEDEMAGWHHQLDGQEFG